MDLVTRLREYIDHIAMPVTQFADACGIPRPSMSQLLSGRNKKVSNELISKIHDAFPDLNVLWLMFGQGDMLVASNTLLSEPQNRVKTADGSPQSPPQQPIAKTVLEFEDNSIFDPDNFTIDVASEVASGQTDYTPAPSFSSAAEGTPSSSCGASPGSIGGVAAAAAVKSSDTSKRIVNIIVYYSDNSFEAFVPE
jgi:transcriptional regulator with XRE-family HTH domain